MANRPIAVLLDLDGTAVDVRPVRHYVAGANRNFDKFHRASAYCPPNPAVLTLAHRCVELGLRIVVMTGRSETYRALSAAWLEKHAVEYDVLLMRAAGDYRADRVVKEELLREVLQTYDVALAIDDNPGIIDLWRSKGIQVVEVPGFDDDYTESVETPIPVRDPFGG